MANANPQLIDMILRVATALGEDLLKRTAFVGGVTTGLFVTDDFAREGVRFTDDVDLIIDIVGHGKWVQFQEELRSRGFRESPEDSVICRMRLGDLKVDFMPDDEKILGQVMCLPLCEAVRSVALTRAAFAAILAGRSAQAPKSKLDTDTGRLAPKGCLHAEKEHRPSAQAPCCASVQRALGRSSKVVAA